MNPATDSDPDRSRSVADYRNLASDYDRRCRRISDIRQAALQALDLHPGNTVFDVACGTGTMLPLLAAAVGPGGRVIGIEHSPEMAAMARQRISDSGFDNIELVVAAAELATVDHAAQALLFCYTHDVLQSSAALDNLFSMTRPGAAVVATGAKLIRRWWSWPIDWWTQWRGRQFRTTRRGIECPWAPLQKYCPDLRLLQTFHLGTNYLARGSFRPENR